MYKNFKIFSYYFIFLILSLMSDFNVHTTAISAVFMHYTHTSSLI